MSAPTIVIGETEAPTPVSYILVPTDINYSVDRCRGRLFRDQDRDSRWSPPVGRESQCTGRVDEDSLCSRCLHNRARWQESCGTAEVRGFNQDWWGRVDDPMPARAPTLACKAWVAENAPVWRPVVAPAAEEDTVESLTATLASLDAESAKLSFDYDCLVEDDEESWPRESENEGLYDDFLKEQAELHRLNKALKDGVILPPAVAAVPATVAETVESLRVKVADKRKKRDGWQRALDGMLEEGWVISRAVLRAFADIREKTATAKEILALRAENAALKADAAAADATAEKAALRARISALEEELADADSLCESLSAQLAGEVQRVNEVGDSARSAFEERMVGVREEAVRACREAADFKAQFEEADFRRRAFEEANGLLVETNWRLRAELEEAFAAKRQFSEDLDGATHRAVEAEESAELVLTSNAALQCRCDEQEETIDELRRVLRGHCADVGELEFLREEVVTQKKLMRERGEAHAEVKAALDKMVVQHGEMTREIAALQERIQVAEHEADEGGEESDAFKRALAHGDDREAELAAERDRWQERFKDLRRLVVETLAEVEPILEREETMPAGVVLRALSVLK